MATRIDTVTARDNLKARHAPYWQKIRSECHLGFRKLTAASSGTWIARYRDSDGKYQINSLGSLSCRRDSGNQPVWQRHGNHSISKNLSESGGGSSVGATDGASVGTASGVGQVRVAAVADQTAARSQTS